MPTLTIKNIPEDLYADLKRYAKINRRTLNAEVILCIERAMRSKKIKTEAYLARARELREKTKRHPISDEEFNLAKVSGRP